MTGIFKANNSYNGFLLLVYAAILKLPLFLNPVTPQPLQIDGFLYRELLKWIEPLGKGFPLIYSLITFSLLYTQAGSFNKMVNDQRIMQKPNYLTGMSYLLITSIFIDWNTLSAPLIINSLLIWVWAKMSSLYNHQKPKSILFNIGIVIGISTFFYFPSLAFAALIIFGLAIIRPFKLAEWLVALLGIITPYYFLLAFVYLTDKWKTYKLPSFVVTNPVFNESKLTYSAIVFISFCSIIGFIYVQQNFRRQLIQARKSWTLIFLYLIVALFVPFINEVPSFEYWILCAIPLSALLGAAFLYPNNKWVPGFMHWLMVGFVILLSIFDK